MFISMDRINKLNILNKLKIAVMIIMLIIPFMFLSFCVNNIKIYDLKSNEMVINRNSILVSIDGEKYTFNPDNRLEYKLMEKDHSVEYIVAEKGAGNTHKFKSQSNFIDDKGEIKDFINKDGTDISADRLKEIDRTALNNFTIQITFACAIMVIVVFILLKFISFLDKIQLKEILK